GLLDVGRHTHDRATPIAELPLGHLQRRREPLQRAVEALVEPVRLEERELSGALLSPLRARPPDEVARRVALAHAAILEDEDLLSVGAAEIAAGQTAEGPTHRRVGAPEVHEVLLGLVR